MSSLCAYLFTERDSFNNEILHVSAFMKSKENLYLFT